MYTQGNVNNNLVLRDWGPAAWKPQHSQGWNNLLARCFLHRLEQGMKIPVEGSLEPRLVQLDQLQVKQMGPKGPIRSPCWVWLRPTTLYFFLLLPLPTAHLCGLPPNWGTRVRQGVGVVLNGYSISSVVCGLAEINQAWSKLAPPPDVFQLMH